MKLKALVGLVLGAWAGLAAADSLRQEFAYAIPLTAPEGAALYRFSLPVDVYLHAARADLGDLRVLNAAGEVVPYALRAGAGEGKQERESVIVPHFPLRGDAVSATQALRLTIRTGDAEIDLHGAADAAVSTAPVTAYLLDLRAQRGAIKALQLRWPGDTADFSTPVTLETSDNLIDWTIVDAAAPLVNLNYGGQRLSQDRIEFAARTAKFWRLRWPAQKEAVPIEAIRAQPADASVELQRLQLTVPWVPAGEGPDRSLRYVADLGAAVPVERFQIAFAQANTVTPIELLARQDTREADKQVERPIWQGIVYRLESADGAVTSPAQRVGTTRAQHWTLRVPRDGGGLGAGTAKFVVEWLPHEVVFAARGAGPYELVYGSGSSLPATVPLDAFVSAQTASGGREAALAIPGKEAIAGGVERLQVPKPAANWRTITLWSVLGLAVVALGWMALRLSRQMK